MVHYQIKRPSNKPDENVKKNTGHPFVLSEKKDLYVWVFGVFFLHKTILPFRANKTDNLKLFLVSSN